MKKRISITILTIIFLTAFSLILFACKDSKIFKQKPIPGDDSKITTTVNNSGFVIERGKYIYFINGNIKLEDYSKKDSNKFGSATQGALYRIEKADFEKNNFNKAIKIIPLTLYSTKKGDGITVIDNWFYYVTPYTDSDVKERYLNFVRTKLDGSITEVIATYQVTNGNKIPQHKFTKEGLYVASDKKIILHKYTEEKVKNDKKDKVIVTENLSDVLMPILINNEDSIFKNAVIFTEQFNENKDKDKTSNNTIYYFDGKERKTLLNASKETTFKLLTYSIDASKVTIYYNQKVLNNNIDTASFSLNEKDFKNIVKTSINEINVEEENIFPLSFEDGLIILDGTKFIQLKKGNRIDITQKIDGTPKLAFVKNNLVFIVLKQKIYVFNLNDKKAAKEILKDNLNDIIMPQFIGDNLFYFDKDNNIAFINISNIDKPLKGKIMQIK